MMKWGDEGRGMGMKRGKALKRTLLHELIRTKEYTFLSCISTSGELGNNVGVVMMNKCTKLKS